MPVGDRFGVPSGCSSFPILGVQTHGLRSRCTVCDFAIVDHCDRNDHSGGRCEKDLIGRAQLFRHKFAFDHFNAEIPAKLECASPGHPVQNSVPRCYEPPFNVGENIEAGSFCYVTI